MLQDADVTYAEESIFSAPVAKTRKIKRKPAVLVADLFCGAGGTSSGARKALTRHGLVMKLVAVNHWPIAVETHSKNHPDARHYCIDLDAAQPDVLVPEGRLDLLMASPSCTHHSRARGGKPMSDQSRMSAWHVVRWCTELRVRCLLIENVSEFQEWGPLDPYTNRPIQSRKGEYFKAWVYALEAIGFRIEHRVLNAADYGDATTRKRFFLIGRSDGKRIRWPVATHTKNGNQAEGQRWRSAREIIDWSLRGRSIFNRKNGLAPKTLDRILSGARRFDWPAAYIAAIEAELRLQLGIVIERSKDILQGSFDVAKRARAAAALLHARKRLAEMAQPCTEVPSGDPAQPFVLVLRQHMAGRSTDEPLPTIAANGNHIGLVEPFVTPYYGSGSGLTGHSVERPLPTLTTKPRFGLVDSFVMPVTHCDTSNRTRSLDDPLPTVTCAQRGELAIIQPVFADGAGPDDISDQGRRLDHGGSRPGIDFDIHLRMLDPTELASSMGFTDEESRYEFVGNKTEITKQIGNSVPVNMAAALISAIFSDSDAGPQTFDDPDDLAGDTDLELAA
jgi:DNA (cytosine-5)-methyltransferase 1